MRDRVAVALELDVSQRTDFFDAATQEKRVRDRRKAADRVRARLLRVSKNENANGAQFAQGDAGARAEQLVGYALLQHVARFVEAHSCYSEGTELRKVYPPIASHDPQVIALGVAEE